ncbi:hypothetical protein RMATCC62417_01924 [Rhizopus microsporus]|nr:hypothetical protein RMATCC62417_01924 [Rhizopus microsporus]
MSTADEDYFAIDSNRIPKNNKALPSDLMTPFSTSSEDQTRSLYSRRRFIPNRWTTPSIKSIRTAKLKRMRLLIKQPHLPEFETQTFCENCEKYIQTRVRYRNGSLVWLLFFMLLLCTVILCWVPFYVKYFKGKYLIIEH